MEEFARQLKAALNHYGVYIGPESLTRQPQLPHVIVIPVEETLTPPMRSGAGVQLAAEAQQTVDNAAMRYFIVHLHRLLDPQA